MADDAVHKGSERGHAFVGKGAAVRTYVVSRVALEDRPMGKLAVIVVVAARVQVVGEWRAAQQRATVRSQQRLVASRVQAVGVKIIESALGRDLVHRETARARMRAEQQRQHGGGEHSCSARGCKSTRGSWLMCALRAVLTS